MSGLECFPKGGVYTDKLGNSSLGSYVLMLEYAGDGLYNVFARSVFTSISGESPDVGESNLHAVNCILAGQDEINEFTDEYLGTHSKRQCIDEVFIEISKT